MDIDKLRSQTKEFSPPPSREARGWVLPVIAVLAVVAVIVAGILVYMTRQTIVSTEAHDVGSTWVATHQVVHAKLGEDIRFGFMPIGTIEDETASLTYSLTGDKAKGRVQLDMALRNDDWIITHAVLESPEGRLVIAEQRPEDIGPEPESQHHVMRGAQLLNAGRTSEALKELEQAVALDAYNPEARVWRGRTFLDLGDLDKARADFDKALELSPALPDAHQGLAMSYVLQDDYQGAMPHLDAWVQAAPEDGQAWQERGYAAFKLDDKQQALSDASKACGLGFQPGCVALQKLGGSLPVPTAPEAPAPE